MFDKIKSLIGSLEKSPTPVENIKKVEGSSKSNKPIYDLFEQQAQELFTHENFPIKAKTYLTELINTLKQIDIDLLTIEQQAKIERILGKEIPEVSEIYFSLPKVHAVSVILDSGKTAKQMLIDQFAEFAKKVDLMWQEAVENQSKAMIQKDKIKAIAQQPKKDFFDL